MRLWRDSMTSYNGGISISKRGSSKLLTAERLTQALSPANELDT